MQAELAQFIDNLDAASAADTRQLIAIMQEVTGKTPSFKSGMIGFGSYHYKYDSGHEGDTPLLAFAKRSDKYTLYLCPEPPFEDLFDKLGKHKRGKGCLYIKALKDVDLKVLEAILQATIETIKSRFGALNPDL